MNFRTVPFYILISITLLLSSSCQRDNGRKIRLASPDTAVDSRQEANSSVLQVSAARQRTIAILLFENQTGDPALDWLHRGLTDMLEGELSQSPYLNVITTNRSPEGGAAHGGSEEIPLISAQDVLVEIIISGRFYHAGDSLCIEVKLFDTQNSGQIRQEKVCGSGLEQIFTMVADLSGRVREFCRNDSRDGQSEETGLAAMTRSVEAFRCYSAALENREKFLYQESVTCLEDALKADTTFAAAYLQLAKLLQELGRRKEYLAALEKAQQYRDRLPESGRIHLALLETRQKESVVEYIDQLEKAVDRLPTDLDVRLELARLYRKLGNLDAALNEFETVLELDPNRKLVYNDIGYLYAERGDFNSAIKYLDKYREMAPDEPNPYDSKGETLMRAGRLREAEQQFRAALAKWPTFGNSVNRLMELAVEKGLFQQALTYLARTRELAKTTHNETEYYDILEAMIRYRFGETARALAGVDGVVNNHPDNMYFVMLAVEMHQDAGDTLAAEKLAQTALTYVQEHIDSDSALAAKSLISLGLMMRDQSETLIPLLEKALTHSHKPDTEALLNFALALAYHRSGKSAPAQKLLAQNVDPLLQLISIENKQGWGSAWKYVFEALDYDQIDTPQRNPFIQGLLKLAGDTGREDLALISHYLQARYYERSGRDDALAAEYAEVGAPPESYWRVIGPFSMGNRSGFEHAFIPETALDLNASYRDQGRLYEWRPGDDGASDGYVNLKKLNGHSLWTVSYAAIYIHSPEKRKVQIRLGCDETGKLWLNDELIWQHYLKRDASPDRDLVTVLLREGTNKLLIKVTNSDFDWGFYLRVTDEKGRGFKDIRFAAPGDLPAEVASSGQFSVVSDQ